jgi:hypothetical protein
MPEVSVVALDPSTLTLLSEYDSVSEAARELRISRQALYQSLDSGDVRAGFRWMRKSAYTIWIMEHPHV